MYLCNSLPVPTERQGDEQRHPSQHSDYDADDNCQQHTCNTPHKACDK